MQKTTILLTGGSGFIGKNLTEQLHGRYTFYIPSHKEVDFINTQAVKDYFSSHKIDIVIHCASIGGKRTNLYIPDAVEKNLKMFFNLVGNRDKFKKMIHLGSGAEYDKSRTMINITEENFGEKIPQDQYGFYKYVCSRSTFYDPKITILRVFGVFGKYEDYTTRFISNNICRTLFNLPISINRNAQFDFIYVNDLVEIIDYFIKHSPKQHVFNIGSGQKMDLVTIAEKIKTITGSPYKIKIKKTGVGNTYTCNNGRLLRQIKGLQFTHIDKAIMELYTWYKQNKKNITPESFLD